MQSETPVQRLHVGRGELRHGNPSGPHFGPAWPGRRCGAKTRSHNDCPNPGMANGRCRMHGGKSTGPKSEEGRRRAKRGNWKHGRRCRNPIWFSQVDTLMRLAEWAVDQMSRLKNGLKPRKCPAALETELAVTMAIMESPLSERED
jgi:hypothetical protein